MAAMALVKAPTILAIGKGCDLQNNLYLNLGGWCSFAPSTT
jgi:hypothetical protein